MRTLDTPVYEKQGVTNFFVRLAWQLITDELI